MTIAFRSLWVASSISDWRKSGIGKTARRVEHGTHLWSRTADVALQRKDCCVFLHHPADGNGNSQLGRVARRGFEPLTWSLKAKRSREAAKRILQARSDFGFNRNRASDKWPTSKGTTRAAGLLVVLLGRSAPVLVGDRAPAEDGHDLGWRGTRLLHRIDVAAQHGATVLPAVAEVEDVFEGVAWPQAGLLQGELPLVQRGSIVVEPSRIDYPDPAAVDEAKLVQMRKIPAREGPVDGRCEVSECVRVANEHIPPRGTGELFAALRQQDHPQDHPTLTRSRSPGSQGDVPSGRQRGGEDGYRPLPFDAISASRAFTMRVTTRLGSGCSGVKRIEPRPTPKPRRVASSRCTLRTM